MSNRDNFLTSNTIGLLFIGVFFLGSSISFVFEEELFSFYMRNQDLFMDMNGLLLNIRQSKYYGLESFATVQLITGLLVAVISFFIYLYIIARSYYCTLSESKQCQQFYINLRIQKYGITQEKLSVIIIASIFGLVFLDFSATGVINILDTQTNTWGDSFFLGTKIGIFVLNLGLLSMATIIAYTIVESFAHIRKYLIDMKITIKAISLYVVLIIIGGYFTMKAIFRFWEVDVYILNGDITSNNLYNILIYSILGILILRLSSFVKKKYKIRVR